jgi:AraC-like DNA-binding protein
MTLELTHEIPRVTPEADTRILDGMEGFDEIKREHWDDGTSVRSVVSYDHCQDYFDEKMKGFRLRIAMGASDVRLAHRNVKMGSSQVDFVQLHCDRDFRVEQPDEFDYYYLKLILSGRCELSVGEEVTLINEGEAAVVNPFGSLKVAWNGLCEQVMIRMDRNALEQTLAEELDIEISDPIRFASVAVSADDSRPVSALVDLIRRDADGPGVFGTWRLGRQFERLVHLAVLQCFPNNYSDLLRRATSMVAPYYVRKAEEYLREHLREDVTIEDIARVTGVSTRSLFYGFRRWRDTTPMAFLKKLRLDVAREALRSAARTGASVTDVATAVGFFHLSRFSSEYKARFGEPPSATLRRG